MRFSLRFMESEVLAGHTGEHLAGRRTELYFSRGPARSLKAWPAVAVASREAGVAPTRWSPVWWAESWILLISWCSYTTHYLLLTLDRLSLFSHWKYPPLRVEPCAHLSPLPEQHHVKELHCYQHTEESQAGQCPRGDLCRLWIQTAKAWILSPNLCTGVSSVSSCLKGDKRNTMVGLLKDKMT